jgi:hypothetical protein
MDFSAADPANRKETGYVENNHHRFGRRIDHRIWRLQPDRLTGASG